jgi:hypothetical protein
MHPFKEMFYSSPSPLILGYEEVQSHSTKGTSLPQQHREYIAGLYTTAKEGKTDRDR